VNNCRNSSTTCNNCNNCSNCNNDILLFTPGQQSS
jgi:hypothetical protein